MSTRQWTGGHREEGQAVAPCGKLGSLSSPPADTGPKFCSWNLPEESEGNPWEAGTLAQGRASIISCLGDRPGSIAEQALFLQALKVPEHSATFHWPSQLLRPTQISEGGLVRMWGRLESATHPRLQEGMDEAHGGA